MSSAPKGGAPFTALLLFFAALPAAFPAAAGASPSAQEVRRIRKLERQLAGDTRPVLQDTRPELVDADPAAGPESPAPAAYVCPMHADYRARAPGVCGVCGMALQSIQAAAGGGRKKQITISRLQAERLTLRFAEVRPLRIERWLRTAAVRTGERILEGVYAGPAGGDIREGQNVRAFPMQSRVRIFRGVVRSAESGPRGVRFTVSLDSEFDGADVYVAEIVVVHGARLAIPSDALLFTSDGPAAFRLDVEDTETLRLSPVPVRIGLRGEMYYEVLRGLAEGDRVAQTGLFHLDAAFQLHR